jgi:valyl-tRNA synthetase
MLQELSALVASATRHLDACDYAAALREIEDFFWRFCDDYIELVKRRRAGEDAAAASAAEASQIALGVLLRLFAPFLPFVTEDVWSWWRDGSVHQAPWPEVGAIETALATAASSESTALQQAREVTALIRHQRSTQKWGFAKPVRARLALTPARQPFWDAIERDILAGNNVASHTVTFDASADDVQIELADPS